MRYITDREYNKRLEKIKSQNKNREKLNHLKQEKNKYKLKQKEQKRKYKEKQKENHTKVSTSKIVLFCMVLLCFEIIIFAEWYMGKFQDSSSMYALIGIPVALTPTIWAYYSKSKAENTEGGITYDIAMEKLKQLKEGCDSAYNSCDEDLTENENDDGNDEVIETINISDSKGVG